MRKDVFKKANKNFANTNLTQVVKEKIVAENTASGYVGVAPRRGKWYAHICYKGKRYFLGCYYKIEDAVKARARAEELVVADAKGLLGFYTELEKTFPRLPDREENQPKAFPRRVWATMQEPSAVDGSLPEQGKNEI